ncbi:Lrp/AsnC family transcriptional regulator [Pseudoglutamicibacter albus]|uniref:Lrp/AsnC family transcriptional regulator n=1 Tax=Pseudoglutamicibacter cumminsii TaxID=156979 RepID=A0ABX5L661_9MICC|nr:MULTISPECIES: Lrp/AsnC family transcriptional regulator [Pseudoglutamicibacter]MDK7083005.1 Lrp/AsnC family transcriptional regulator [Pseudoglutamicibacter cumminsii]MDZ3745092.1 Lrp/AsnC family transcriptional regulator [Pseudoglutamicibacter cumminsii]PKY80218.1 transcriptional regulator [Pseudoglutamicibacter albus]PWI28298.1 Lrp/AsnC family transcriptional regulator [Pseudoglutamicibacter cumminsii]WIK83816.1 Lrp/AsnC family transcriptional regulator [Pseudoglutamicibacter albus]
MSQNPAFAPALDAVDAAIVSELLKDGRASVSAIASNVHISRAHAYQRIASLRERGVITGYTATVNHAAMGLRSSAYVTLKLRQHSWRALQERLSLIPEVHHFALVGGTFDVMLLVRAADNEALRRVVFEVLQPMPEVMDTQTHLIFEDHEPESPDA